MHTHAHTNAHVINSLVVLIGSCEVIGFHGVPAQCVAPHCHYHLQEQTDDKSPNEREQTQHGEFSAATFLRGVDSLMSYSTILLSEAQLARSSVCVTETKTHRTVKHLSVLSVNCNIFFFTILFVFPVFDWTRPVWVSYFHGVEVDGAEAVHPPGEWADGAAPLLIPDVHLLATRSKQTLLPVMVQACKHCLHRDKIHFPESERFHTSQNSWSAFHRWQTTLRWTYNALMLADSIRYNHIKCTLNKEQMLTNHLKNTKI